MTSPRIRILSERLLTTSPEPGETAATVALTYQLPPRPPSVVFVPADQLVDVVWRQEHATGKIPVDLVDIGDKVRRKAIEAQLSRSGSLGPVREI